MKLFGQYLRSKRQQVGLSQLDVSKKLGYTSSQFVSNWERGVSAPPLSIYHQLADLYQLGLEDLFEQSLEAKVREVRSSYQKEFEIVAQKQDQREL